MKSVAQLWESRLNRDWWNPLPSDGRGRREQVFTNSFLDLQIWKNCFFRGAVHTYILWKVLSALEFAICKYFIGKDEIIFQEEFVSMLWTCGEKRKEMSGYPAESKNVLGGMRDGLDCKLLEWQCESNYFGLLACRFPRRFSLIVLWFIFFCKCLLL